MNKKFGINTKLIIETIGVFVSTSIVAVLIHQCISSPYKWFLQFPLLVFQGFWFYRFYIVGHEASHKKLFPGNIRKNDFWGSVILLPLMTPLTIYRKIHYFHHGFNRKDHHTSALDTFVLYGKITPLKKLFYFMLWYVNIFLGGFFIHSLISVLLFLFIPVSLTQKISPAFKGWTWRDQIKSILLFLGGVGFHISVYHFLGKEIYLYSLGFPMFAFAWILSLMVYIFHYDTTKGDEVRFHVRSAKRVPVISWILMNFNEHATHHQYPNIPWYELPYKKTPLPEQYHQKNQHSDALIKIILQQLKGPTLILEDEHQES